MWACICMRTPVIVRVECAPLSRLHFFSLFFCLVSMCREGVYVCRPPCLPCPVRVCVCFIQFSFQLGCNCSSVARPVAFLNSLTKIPIIQAWHLPQEIPGLIQFTPPAATAWIIKLSVRLYAIGLDGFSSSFPSLIVFIPFLSHHYFDWIFAIN